MPPMEPPFNTLPPEGPPPGLDRKSKPLRQAFRHILMIAAGLVLWFLFTSTLLPKLKEALDQPPLPSTQNAMKQICLVFKMYANESEGNRWPSLAAKNRTWAPDLSVLYPEFLQDSSVLVAREHPDAEHVRESLKSVLEGPNPDYDTAAGLMALSFAYLGHAVRDESGFRALIQARNQGLIDSSAEDKPVHGYSGTIYTLRKGIERFFITDSEGVAAQSVIPVLIEIAGWRHKTSLDSYRGAHVLYMEGRVELVPLGTFPVVPSVMDRLCGMAP